MINKFLKVEANNIERVNLLVNRHLTICSGSDLLSEIFTKYDVPEKYQKVFFYKKILNNCIREFFTDTSFDLRKTEVGNIKARLNKKDNNEKLGFHLYLIDSSKANCSKDYIINFYLTMYDNGYLRKYLSTLNEYFLLNMDANYIFELSEGNEQLSKQMKSYKKKILERK